MALINIGGKKYTQLSDVPPSEFAVPSQVFAPATPSDTVNEPGGPWRYLIVGTAGLADIAMNDTDNTVVASIYLSQGRNDISASRINLTNLAASNIVVCY